MLTDTEAERIVVEALGKLELAGKRVLLIIPDATRTAPVGLLFRLIHQHLTAAGAGLDIMIALGTHPPMSDEAIHQRLEITAAQRTSTYAAVRFLNHSWDVPTSLAHIGTIASTEIGKLTDAVGDLHPSIGLHLHRQECLANRNLNLVLVPGHHLPRATNQAHLIRRNRVL